MERDILERALALWCAGARWKEIVAATGCSKKMLWRLLAPLIGAAETARRRAARAARCREAALCRWRDYHHRRPDREAAEPAAPPAPAHDVFAGARFQDDSRAASEADGRRLALPPPAREPGSSLAW